MFLLKATNSVSLSEKKGLGRPGHLVGETDWMAGTTKMPGA